MMLYQLANIFVIIAGVIFYFIAYKNILEANRDNQLFSKLGLALAFMMIVSIACMVVATANLLG